MPKINAHDELLEAVKDNPLALAVVKLHKPHLVPHIGLFCVACETKQLGVLYPCPTIKVIQKELK